MIFSRIIIPLYLTLCMSMIFFRKPVPTFRDHALAGARALLVSHWLVESNAAMRLTTRSLGNEVVTRIDHQQRGDVPIVCRGIHGGVICLLPEAVLSTL